MSDPFSTFQPQKGASIEAYLFVLRVLESALVRMWKFLPQLAAIYLGFRLGTLQAM